MLAALGLLAVAEQDVQGYSLRSRCDLVCENQAPFEVVHLDGSTTEIALNRTSALNLYRASFEAATKAGFEFPAKPVRLTPQDKLVKIVRDSQELALEGEGGESGEAE